MPPEDEPSHRGDADRAAGVFGERGAPWALCAPGGGTLVCAPLRGADDMQAPHSPGAPVLQEPPFGYAEVYTAI